MRRLKVGLALGGGGARGLAHIGVLKVLEREGIKIDIIVGTSMGAMIGGLYAINPKVDVLEKQAKAFLRGDDLGRLKIDLAKQNDSNREDFFMKRFVKYIKEFYRFSLLRRELGLVKSSLVTNVIDRLLPDVDITECKIPFAALAADISSGREMVFDSGPIRKAVLSSIALTGILPPVEHNGSFLVDGGVLSTTPVVEAYQLGADVVIAVDVKGRLKHLDPGEIKSGIEAIARTHYINSIKLNEMILTMADVVISPRVKNVHREDFEKMDRCIREGEVATYIELKNIRNLKRRKNISTFLRRMLE